MDNLLNCPICCSKLKSPVSLVCGHTFCYHCMHRSLSTIPRCPLCRAYVQVKPDCFKVNIIIHSIIQKADRSPIELEQIESITEQPNCILLHTREDLFAYSFQKLQILKIKDSNLTLDDYIDCLSHAEVFITNDSTKSKVIARVERVQIINNNLYIYALTQKVVELSDKTLQVFVIESTDQFGIKDKKEIILPISKGKLIEENIQLTQAQLIELNEIKHRIVLTVEKIFNKSSLLDAIEQEVYQKLHQCCLFEYFQETDASSLIKFSFCLTSMLKITNKVKQEILAQTVVKRLKLAEQQLNKLAPFKHGGMIFCVPNDHPKPPFIQLVIVIIFIILYLIFIN